MAEEDELNPEAQEQEQEAQEVPAGKAPSEEDACPECAPCKKGAPLWMATFADMATLLMAFFVLILSFSEMKTLKYIQIAGTMKSAFGVQKVVSVPEPPKGTSIISLSFSPTQAQQSVIDQVKQQTTNHDQKNVELQTKTKSHDYDVNAEVENVKETLKEEIAKGQVEVYADENQVVIELQGPGTSGENDSGADNDQGQQQGMRDGERADSSEKQAQGEEQGEAQGQQVSQQSLETQGQETSQQLGQVTEGTLELYSKVAQASQETVAEVTVIDVAKQQEQQQQQQDLEKQQRLEAQAAQAASDLAVVMSQAVSQGLAEVEREGTKVIVRLAERGTFGPGDAKLNPSAIPTIRAMQEMIDQNTGTVRVSGHTDNRGIAAGSDFHSNWDLSSVRAAAVADTLRTILGVESERLTVEGLADSNPLNDNATAAERARNRRVEIILDVAE